MSEWGKLIRQKAAKGGCLAPEEQRRLQDEAGIEIGLRLHRRQTLVRNRSLRELGMAAKDIATEIDRKYLPYEVWPLLVMVIVCAIAMLAPPH